MKIKCTEGKNKTKERNITIKNMICTFYPLFESELEDDQTICITKEMESNLFL